MIPYSLFMFRIVWPDVSLDIRACDLTGNGFRFRVAEKRYACMEIPAEYFVCFFNRETGQYDEYEVTGSIERDRDGYVFQSEDKRFLTDLNKLMRDYMHMISVKLENDELDAMCMLTGLELSENYESDIGAWKRKFCRPQKNLSAGLLPVEIGISLDEEKMWQKYTELGFDNFIDYYLKENCLSECGLTEKEITHIYIGNQYCRRLFPDEGLLDLLLEKTFSMGRNPVIAFAPLRQSTLDKTEARIVRLSRNFEKYKKKIELVINDFGIADMIRSLEAGNRIERDCFKITAGVLLNKRKKDPRMVCSRNYEKLAFCSSENMFNDSTVSDYLRNELGIGAVSYEACGYRLRLGTEEAVLHLPMYQTNTSDCIMCSLSQSSDRGMITDTDRCPGYCRGKYIYYPDNLPIIGMWNSVFSVSNFEINDTEYLNSLIRKGLKRLVFRL